MSGLRRETGGKDGLKTNIRAVIGPIHCRCNQAGIMETDAIEQTEEEIPQGRR
jgi:hypothetical protein